MRGSAMTPNAPPQAHAAIDQLRKALRAAEGRDIDPLTAPWGELEPGVVKLLGGAFAPDRQPSHQAIAMMIASAFAERTVRDVGAFWFANRASAGGASLGFPEAVVVVSPLEVAMQALGRARLAILDDVTAELRGVLGRAKFAPDGGGETAALGPAEYQRLFDPGFVQFVAVDLEKARAGWEATGAAEAREIEDAIGRLPAKMNEQVREQLRQRLVGAIRQADPDQPLGAQAARAPQLVELVALLHGSKAGTGFAPEEVWQDVVLPLLHIGAPESFPPLDDDELEAVRTGVDPVMLYVEAVPFQVSVADEDGLLGVFPPEELGVLDPCFAESPSLRLLRVPPERLAQGLATFDPTKLRETVLRFRAYAHEKAAIPVDEQAADGTPLLDVSLTLLQALARVSEAAAGDGFALCVRRVTEAEASSEAALHEVRLALTGPRIVLV